MMPSSKLSDDFRGLEKTIPGGRASQLFRASASAFASLSRPLKSEQIQFEELSLALYDNVPPEAKKHAAVVISANAFAPRELVIKLCNEPVAICAPILARSPILKPSDIPVLIARHGTDHARVLAGRTDLDTSLRALLMVFVQMKDPGLETEDEGRSPSSMSEVREIPTDMPGKDPHEYNGSDKKPSESRTRMILRSHMAANTSPATQESFQKAELKRHLHRLRTTALNSDTAFLGTALADALDIPFSTAIRIINDEGQAGLIMALRSLPMGGEDAFAIASSLWPHAFTDSDNIALFMKRYAHVSLDAARQRVERWKETAEKDDVQVDKGRAAPFRGYGMGTAKNDQETRRSFGLKAS